MINKQLSAAIVSRTAKYVPRMCWSNAVEALVTSGHPALKGAVYVEGWAIPPGLDFPIEHAWIRLASREIIELTWLDIDNA